METRPLYQHIWNELSDNKAMVFISGPRQAGKTTLARLIGAQFANVVYCNYDLITHKKLLNEKPTFFEDAPRRDASPPLVIFDEIHKHRRWKNYLKGIYDQYAEHYRFLVLGSGCLNVFQKGGDSLAGRYALFTLWPLTLAELMNQRRTLADFLKNPTTVIPPLPDAGARWNDLGRLSGFPEPFFSGKENAYRRWANTYHKQLIREDIRNMTEIKNIDDVEILFSLLPSRIGSPISMDALARDIQVSFNSIRHWLNIFESFYLIFRLSPWTKKISRAITREKKLYFFDTVAVVDPAARFENMVALELLRAVSNWNDLGEGRFGLHYLRTKEKEEVDFVLSANDVPFLLIETKLSDDVLSKSLAKFQNRLDIPSVQLVNQPNVLKILNQGRTLVISAHDWLPLLP
ncbi:MAG: ATP-binding protein [Desulfobacteraceae bacterium]|nr:MAG: ATP-binding protein [Desulfobacteraceae bacterium]